MENYLTPQFQEKQAKLSLLVLDDDTYNDKETKINDDSEHWGCSMQTQMPFDQKYSQRYKTKSRRSLKLQSSTNNESKQTKSFFNDKNSLKQILKKLESKQLKSSRTNIRQSSMIVEFKQNSKSRNWILKNQSKRSALNKKVVDNKSTRKELRHINKNSENNFISKKIQIYNPNKNINGETINQLFSMSQKKDKNKFNQVFKRKQFLLENHQQKKFSEKIFKKNSQNKENQIQQLYQFSPHSYKHNQAAHNFIFILKNDSNCKSLIKKQEINKRTFQILHEINQAKSINNVRKLTSQSLRLKKPQMCSYSKVLKDCQNLIGRQSQIKHSILLNNDKQKTYLKLQIRK